MDGEGSEDPTELKEGPMELAAGSQGEGEGRWKVSCGEEEGLLAGLAFVGHLSHVVVCWAWGVAGDRVEESGDAGSFGLDL